MPRAQYTRPCEYCGKPITYTNRHINRRFCDKACSNHARTRPPLDRYWEKVQKSADPDVCWLWIGLKDAHGYGLFQSGGRGSKRYVASRYAYELAYGPIPEGMYVCHRCDNPSCVNPAHLFAGTQKDNIQDMANKGRHWMQQHPERTPRGERNSRAQLTDAQAIEIRARYDAGEVTQVELTREYGVSKTVIWGLVHRRSWKHLN